MIKPYYLREISDDNFSDIYTLFPMTSMQISGEWDNYDMLDEHIYAWLYLYPGAVSLVYVPSAYPSFFDGGKIYHWKEEGSSIIQFSSEEQGIKLVTGYGNVIYMDEQVGVGRFTIPTKEELERYYALIQKPEKYQIPLHRFIQKALTRY